MATTQLILHMLILLGLIASLALNVSSAINIHTSTTSVKIGGFGLFLLILQTVLVVVYAIAITVVFIQG